MPDELAKEMAIEATKAVVTEGYKDLLQPTFQSVGNVIALPFQAVEIALEKVRLWVVEKQYGFEKTKEILAQKLKDVPKEKIVPPEKYVAVPALQQISYCFDSDELREMYANLLASSMNIDSKYSVHPAFVEIIKQLAPDEAKLLKSISQKEIHPLIGVDLISKDKGYIAIVKNFTNIAYGVCDYPQGIFSYLDNLERLKIIDISSDQLLDPVLYTVLEKHSYIQKTLEAKLLEGQYFQLSRAMFRLTEFGKNFIKVCMD